MMGLVAVIGKCVYGWVGRGGGGGYLEHHAPRRRHSAPTTF